VTKIWLGPQGEPVEIREKPDSSVASGTDRSELEFAATKYGPQGELLVWPDAICPTCGQPFPETASQNLALDTPPISGDEITELSA